MHFLKEINTVPGHILINGALVFSVVVE